jgi:RND superfamily putative drug exporter
LFRRIAAFSVRFRWAVLLVWLAAVPLAVFVLPSLSSVTTDDNASFLPKSSETHKAAELEKPFRSESVNGSATVVIARNTSVLTADDYAYIKALGQKVQAVTNVKVVENRGVSTDGKAVQLYVGVDASPTSKEGERLVGDIRALFSAGRPSGLAVHLTGSFPVVVDASTERNRNVDRTGKFTVVLIVLLLFFVFRSLLAPLLALVPAMVALAIAGPVIGGFSKLGLEVSSVTELLLTVLILGAGTDYGLFFVFRVREQLRSGQKPNEAVMSALEKVGESITFSALTVMAALVSLLLAKFGLYKGLGPGLAIGLAVMLA